MNTDKQNIKNKKICSCSGTNINCYKCNGTGYVIESKDNLIVLDPLQNFDEIQTVENKKNIIFKLSSNSKKINVNPNKFMCRFCFTKFYDKETLIYHLKDIHKTTI